MITHTLKTLGAAVTLGLAATAVQAAPVSSVGGVNLANNGQISNSCGFCTTYDFNNGLLPAVYSGNGAVVTGSIAGQWAQPTSPTSPNTTAYLVTPAQGGTGSVTLTLPGMANYFGFFAGSIDLYNSISFFNGVTLMGTVTGADLIALPNPDLIPGNQAQAAYYNIAFLTGGFNRVVLSSQGIAFETDNHTVGTVQIPVPGAAALMLSGLFGMVFASRRQKKAVQVA
ncbi:MAG: hypothetical protein K2W80_18415 [Burkholderiales bacterium]|nr:hypothetical protein [Burkholderiales bacterium]